MQKVACPFCKPKKEALRGEGCCNCEHTGMVPIGESFEFHTTDEAVNHDPEISYHDLKHNRLSGNPLNYKPF